MKWLVFVLIIGCFVPGAYADESIKETIQQQLSAERLDDAEDTVEDWVKNEPENAEAWHIRGIVMAQQAQDSFFSALSYAGKSVDSFEKAVELEPGSLEYRTALLQFYMMAPSIAGGDDEKALAQIEAIKEIDAVEGAFARVKYLQHHEKEEQARKLVNEILAEHPNNADVLVYLGFQEQKDGNYEKAFSFFEQAAEGESRKGEASVMALYQFGKTSVLAEEHLDKGIVALQQYLDAELPDSAPKAHWANFRLAQLLALKGNDEESQQLIASLKKVDDKDLQKQLSSWN
ncbi:tetratricopeptide repeat protein [Idiomarina sp.]|uniref:tetratricopeptide repeat protein n=1 Tax=Idiomarina sp. TaxID=1874361 RepID=UPI003A8D3951